MNNEKSKHTPAPWLVKPMTGDGKLFVMDKTDEPVAQLWYSDLSDLKANAKLIATAPELLTELRRTTELIEGAVANDSKMPEGVKEILKEQIESNITIIKKATE